jgi:cell division protein FtsB
LAKVTVRLERPTRPQLRAGPRRRVRAGRGLFFAVVGTVLSLGLVALLGINTLLAQGSFTVHDLEADLAELGAREAALQEEIAALAAPRRLAEKARSLGMVQSEIPVFLRLSDGAVLGQANPAAPPPAAVKPEPQVAPVPAIPPASAPATTPAPAVAPPPAPTTP